MKNSWARQLLGIIFHYSAFSLDNDWLITPSTQEKQVLISVDGGGQYQLIYNIQVEQKLDILKDFPEEIPGFSLQSPENPLPLLRKSIKTVKS